VELVDQVKRDDLFQKKQESQHKPKEAGDSRQAKLLLAGLVVVFLILLGVFLATR
jgi:hypothetical protein